MIVRLAADGVLVQDADDCADVHVVSDLDASGLRAALGVTESGELLDEHTVLLDLAVLRSRAKLVATAADWPRRWESLTAASERAGVLTPDRRAIRVRVDR